MTDSICLGGYSSTRNFGDAVNLVLAKKLSGKNPISRRYFFPNAYKNRIKYFFIGSTLSGIDDKSIIYGAGFISEQNLLNNIPLAVLSVRGPLSREILIKNGVDCPKIYGDPALLLPRYYSPQNICVKECCGIVPHYVDQGNPLIENLITSGGGEINICIKHSIYKEWKSMIDKFCSHDIIISTTLHGLIIGDAYKKKTLWIKVSDNVLGDDFKFYDYYSSMNINQADIMPIDLREKHYSLNELADLATIKPIENIDIDLLLSQNPWNIG